MSVVGGVDIGVTLVGVAGVVRVEKSTATLVLMLLVLLPLVLGHANGLSGLSVCAGLAVARVVGLVDARLEVTVAEAWASVING